MSFNQTMSLLACDCSHYLVIIVLAEDEKGWSRDMLKLVFTSGDLDAFPFRFNPTSRLFPLDYQPATDEVNMGAIEKAQSFRKRSWRFLVAPFGSVINATHEVVSLMVSPSWG